MNGKRRFVRLRRVLARITYITCITCITSAAVAADKPFASPDAVTPAPAASAGSLLQVTLSLALVLAAVFAAGWVVRRLRSFGKFGGGEISIIADVAVGTKERAVLVQVGGQQLLLGVAPGRVNTLHVLAEPVATSAAAPAVNGQPSTVNTPDFKAILKRSLGLK